MEITLTRLAAKSLDKLPDSLARKIVLEIEKLTTNPFPLNSKKLAGQQNYRLRIGTYRVIYTFSKTENVLTILRVAHRREVYR